MKRAEAITTAGFGALGLAWSWWGSVYDLRWPGARVVVTLLGMVVSFAAAWTGLAAARVPRERRAETAVWAVLPWNGLLLSQIAYVGYFFIPLEVLASALLLRRRATLSRRAAFLLATGVRAVDLVVVIAVAAAARQWLRR